MNIHSNGTQANEGTAINRKTGDQILAVTHIPKNDPIKLNDIVLNKVMEKQISPIIRYCVCSKKIKCILTIVLIGVAFIAGAIIAAVLLTKYNKSYYKKLLTRFENEKNEDLFDAYLYTYGYNFVGEERTKRFDIFVHNLGNIKAENKRVKVIFQEGITKFLHLTDEEFKKIYLTNKVEDSVSLPVLNDATIITVKGTPPQIKKDIDWRWLFGPVRSQGECGSCYAFSVAGAVEANWFLSNQNKYQKYFSPQQIVSCSQAYPEDGCDGGSVGSTLRYVFEEGILGEDEYPYVNGGKETAAPCNNALLSKTKAKQTIKGWKKCKNCTLDDWYILLQQGPIMISVDGNTFGRYEYQTDKYISSRQCKELNHAVIAVGWKKTIDGDVIIVRNSWDNDWGDDGYGYILIEEEAKFNNCFYTSYGYLPIVV